MISIQDPHSMSHEERVKNIDIETYLSATQEEMRLVYNQLKEQITDPLQSDLLDFHADIWGYARAYIKSGELWKRFGFNGESQIVTINVEDRHNEILKFQRYTKSQLIALSKEGHKTNELSKLRLEHLNKAPKGVMLMTFYDPIKQALHGFPFDITFFDNYHEDETKSSMNRSFVRKRSTEFTLDD